MATYALQRKGLDVTVGLKRTGTVSAANEIPNLAQVQTIAEGLSVLKEAVSVDGDNNFDIATGGLTTMDGYAIQDGDRVLLHGQTDAKENGIYIAGTGAWSRSDDADTQAELKPYSAVRVLNGTHAGRTYQLLSTTNPVPDTDAQTWAVTSSSSDDAVDVDVVDTSFTQLTGTNAQAVIDDIDNKLQDIHDERKAFASTTLTSGTGIVFNHALNNQFLGNVKVYESASPYTDITADVTIVMTDANNTTITNDGANVDVIVVCTK